MENIILETLDETQLAAVCCNHALVHNPFEWESEEEEQV